MKNMVEELQVLKLEKKDGLVFKKDLTDIEYIGACTIIEKYLSDNGYVNFEMVSNTTNNYQIHLLDNRDCIYNDCYFEVLENGLVIMKNTENDELHILRPII